MVKHNYKARTVMMNNQIKFKFDVSSYNNSAHKNTELVT